MKMYEVNERTDLVPVLMNIWEASVRATHHFLSTGEIEQIKTYVPQAIKGVEHLIIAENESGTPIAFMGTGRKLIQYGIEKYRIQEVTVNEQNLQAVGFYEHLGFQTYKRMDCDEEGNPYPLLYMKIYVC